MGTGHAQNSAEVGGIPLTRYWLIPDRSDRASMSPTPECHRRDPQRTQAVWDRFYKLRAIWTRSNCITTLKGRLTFVLISKLYRQM